MDRIAGIPVKQSQLELLLSFLSADCEICEFLFSQVQQSHGNCLCHL